MLVEINRLNFEHYHIKFWTERNLVKEGANPKDRTCTPGNIRSLQGPKRVQNRSEFYIPIATERDWVASHTTLVQPDWRALCQSTLPAAKQKQKKDDAEQSSMAPTPQTPTVRSSVHRNGFESV